MYTLTHTEVENLTRDMADRIMAENELLFPVKVYPVPRGGIPVAYLLKDYISIEIVCSPIGADIVVDDLVDSGATRAKMPPAVPFYALIDKSELGKDHPYKDWIVFPWERGLEGNDESITDNVVRLLQYIGEDDKREGLRDTPKRVIKAWDEWTSGYAMNPAEILKTFEDGNTDEMVIERKIPFFSHCEHHMAPFFGTVDIGYIPNGRIVGLSKMNRLVECFSRRLQVQERMGQQIAEAMMEHLDAKGVGVIVTGRHMCAMSRGVRHSGCDMVTSAMRGCFMDGLPRQEFLALTR